MTAAAAIARRNDAQRRGVTINLRAPAQLKDLIDRAAAILGKTRSEFMLDSARRYAEDVLLDQRLFVLDTEKYDEFIKLLDRSSHQKGDLKRLLSREAPWEK